MHSQGCGRDEKPRKLYKNEARFIEAFAKNYRDIPPWYYDTRASTHEEDARMIDAVIRTDERKFTFFIQIKASKKGEERFWERLPKVVKDEAERFRYICVVVGKTRPLKSIRKETFKAIQEKRRVLISLPQGGSP